MMTALHSWIGSLVVLQLMITPVSGMDQGRRLAGRAEASNSYGPQPWQKGDGSPFGIDPPRNPDGPEV